MKTRSAFLGLLLVGGLGCGGSNGMTAADLASASPDLAPAGPQVMNDCTVDAFADLTTATDNDRMIMVKSNGTFDYPCMTILAEQSIIFMWKFSSYPLAPGVAPSHTSDPAGATDTPIEMHSTGNVYSVQFPSAGEYPYYVTGHDAKMLGVIQVQ